MLRGGKYKHNDTSIITTTSKSSCISLHYIYNRFLIVRLKEVGTFGKKGYYEGRIAKAVVDVVQKFGGVMTLEDLQSHVTTYEEPISVDYRGYRLWEIPPNGHGMAALMALNILEAYDLKSKLFYKCVHVYGHVPSS